VEFDSEPKSQKKKASNIEDDSADKGSGKKKSQVQTELEEVKQQLRVLQEKDREDKLIERLRAEVLSAIPKSDGAQAKLVNGILSNFPAVVTGLSGIIGSKETAADLLEKVTTIWTNIEGSMPRSPDPVQQAKALAELLFSLVDRVKPPPVQTGGSSSGLASFVSSFVDQLGRKYLEGQGQPVQALPGMQPQLQPVQGAGFSGIPAQNTGQATTQGPPPEVRGQAPQGKQAARKKNGVNVATLFQSIGVDPVAKLRAMVKGQADPEEIADAVVYVFEFVGNFIPPDSPFSPYITGFIDNPEQYFGKACASIPELLELAQQDPEYLARLRAAIIERVQQYRVQIQQAFSETEQATTGPGAPEPETADVDMSREPAAEPVMETTAE